MEITINDKRKIYAIQQEFCQVYPYLKLEFVAKPHKVGGGPEKKFIRDSSKILGEYLTVQNKGRISINPEVILTELEQRFSDIYGLGVYVFCRSCKICMETTVSHGWTCNQQNKRRESLSS